MTIILDSSIEPIKRIFANVGAVSLESYLFNVYTISVLKTILKNQISSFAGVLTYVCVAIYWNSFKFVCRKTGEKSVKAIKEEVW